MNKLFWTWLLMGGSQLSWASSGGHGSGGHSSGGHSASAHPSGTHAREHLGPGYTGSWRPADPQGPLPPSYYSELLTPPLKHFYWYQGRQVVVPLPEGRDSAQAPPNRPLTTAPIAGTTSNGYVQAGGYALVLLLLYAWRRVSRTAPAGK